MNTMDKSLLVSLLTQKLASDLDEGNKESANVIGPIFSLFPIEYLIVPFREYLGLDRVVKHGLDEDKQFSKHFSGILRKMGRKILPLVRDNSLPRCFMCHQDSCGYSSGCRCSCHYRDRKENE